MVQICAISSLRVEEAETMYYSTKSSIKTSI